MTNIIQIDRNNEFQYVEFLKREGAPIIPKQNSTVISEDSRALALVDLDLNKVVFYRFKVQYPDHYISEKKFFDSLIGSGLVPLDANIFETLLRNPERIPRSWEEKKIISFYGTRLSEKDIPGAGESRGEESRDEEGNLENSAMVFCLMFEKNGKWTWCCPMPDNACRIESACIKI